MARRRRRRYYYSSARRTRARANDKYEPVGLDLAPETKRGIAIVIFLVAAAVSGMGILGFAGSFGDQITNGLKALFGGAAYAAPLIFFGVALSLFFGVRWVRNPEDKDDDVVIQTSVVRTYIGSILFVLAVTGLLHTAALHQNHATAFELVQSRQGGGYLGVLTSVWMYALVGYAASVAVLCAIVLIALLITFDLSLHGIFRFFVRSLAALAGRPEEAPDSQPLKKMPLTTPPAAVPDKVKINTMDVAGFGSSKVSRLADADPTPARHLGEDAGLLGGVARAEQAKLPLLEAVPKKFQKSEWKLPPTDLLEETKTNIKSGNIEANVKIIKKTLADFGVVVEMGEVNVGPTVTQYTFRPAVGVKLATITSRADDLALALAAPSIRIEAPIPGKSLVGIEVPNTAPTMVRLRELIDAPQFREASTLNFALGRDVAGHPVYADLEKMPHLLIAGASGMGKSVCLNAIMTSFLYENSPEELQMIVIDPKRVDLTAYSGIPHLLTPVVTDHKKAINALKWAVAQMDGRYQILSESGKRNIQEYNQSGKQPMPFIVIVVDELAQLMSLAKNEVETTIVRLAQMARAVGIHLILATQRPSVDVITGLIKANITTRIAFGVASQVDSRTILDVAGAETLLGRGDMLYLSPDLPKPKRIQAPLIASSELGEVLGFIRQQSGPVDYDEDILEKAQKGGMAQAGDDDMDDDMINAAIEEITRARKASASLLQRRLSVGYARAARILDILEQRGLIGPADGAKPREIYIEDASESEG